MKKELKGFLVGVLITSTVMFGVPAFAESISKSISVSFNAAQIALSGKAVTLDNFIYEGSTYVNLAKICDLLGKTTSWDSKTKTINIIDKNANDSKDSLKPDATKPDATKPDATKPDATKPDTTKPADKSDSQAPKIISVDSLEGGTAVEVTFNEVVDKASAEDISNYTLSCGSKSTEIVVQISSAVLDSTGTKVTLNTEQQKKYTVYRLITSNVKDLAGNIIPKRQNSLLGCKPKNLN